MEAMAAEHVQVSKFALSSRKGHLQKSRLIFLSHRAA